MQICFVCRSDLDDIFLSVSCLLWRYNGFISTSVAVIVPSIFGGNILSQIVIFHLWFLVKIIFRTRHSFWCSLPVVKKVYCCNSWHIFGFFNNITVDCVGRIFWTMLHNKLYRSLFQKIEWNPLSQVLDKKRRFLNSYYCLNNSNCFLWKKVGSLNVIRLK